MPCPVPPENCLRYFISCKECNWDSSQFCTSNFNLSKDACPWCQSVSLATRLTELYSAYLHDYDTYAKNIHILDKINYNQSIEDRCPDEIVFAKPSATIWFFMTICPPNDISFDNFDKFIKKFVSTIYIEKAFWNYEWTNGENNLHSHLVIWTSQKNRFDQNAMRTLKQTKWIWDINKSKKSSQCPFPLQDKIDYMKGNTECEHKNAQKKIDKENRLKFNTPDFNFKNYAFESGI